MVYKKYLIFLILVLTTALLIVGRQLFIQNNNKVVPSVEKTCNQNIDCVLVIRLDECCSCPYVVTRKQLEKDKNLTVYIYGKNYNPEKKVDCQNTICAPCQFINEVMCLRSQCQVK